MTSENTPEFEERNVELTINEVQNNSPDQPVTIGVDAPTKDLASRMEDAFDKNLDNLIRDVQAPPPPIKFKKPKKIKEVKIKKIKVKTYPYKPLESSKDPNFNAFLGRKIMSAFSLAATARKNAKENGEETNPKGFFLKKALGFEFGGDLLNRTKGIISENPSEEQDPTLSKGKRFAAVVGKNVRPSDDGVSKSPAAGTQSYEQPSLFDTKKYTAVNDTSVKTVIEKGLEKLKGSYVVLDNILGKVSSKKSDTRTDDNLLENLSNSISDLKESVKKSNIFQKNINIIKNKQIKVEQKITEQDESAKREAQLEKSQDLSSNSSYENPYNTKKKKGMLQRAMDFISGDDYDTDGEDDGGDDGGGGGPDIDIDLPDGKQRRPGVKRRLLRRKFGGITRRLKPGKIPLPKIPKIGMPKIGMPKGIRMPKIGMPRISGSAGPLNALFAGFEFAGRKSEGQSNVQAGVGTAASTVGGMAGAAAGAQGGAIAGAAIGALFGGVGAVPGAAIGGILGSILGGFGGSMGAGALADKATGADKVQKKMAEGGVATGGANVMIGEAGPEMVLPANNPLAMSSLMPGMGSVGVILGATRKIVGDTATAGPIKPFMEQIIGPLAKVFGSPAYAMNSKVGNNITAVREPKIDGEEGLMGLLKKLLKFFTGGGDDTENKTDPKPKNNNNGSSGQWGALLDLISSKESGGNYEAMNPSTTLPGATKMTISEVARKATGAVGKYQQLPEYLVSRAKAAGLNPDTDLFSPENQDLIVSKVNIEQNRGGKAWLEGKKTDDEFMHGLAYEFASLPGPDGKFKYGGQSSSHTPQDVRSALQQVKSGGGSPTVAKSSPQSTSPTTPQASSSSSNQKPTSIGTKNSKKPSSSKQSWFGPQASLPSTVTPSMAPMSSGGTNNIIAMGGGSQPSVSNSGGGGTIIQSPINYDYTNILSMRLSST
jgi:hypothetical protein